MKYKLVSGLKLQYGYTQTSNRIVRNLIDGQEVELNKEELAEFESLGVQVKPTQKKKPSKKEEK